MARSNNTVIHHVICTPARVLPDLAYNNRGLLDADEPLIVQGAALAWPASSWSVTALLKMHGDVRGTTRIADAQQASFPYVDPWIGCCAKWTSRTWKAPVTSKTMKLRDVVNNLHERRMYFQGAVRGTSIHDDVGKPALSLNQESDPLWRAIRAGAAAGNQEDDIDAYVEAQQPRLWISADGSVSPTHFDESLSVLVQLHGQKRMLLFDPACTARLCPYPNHHPLRRRAMVDITADEVWLRSRFPRFFEEPHIQAVEAVVNAGDVLVFPARWMHWTETVSPVSCSLTRRFRPRRRGQRRSRPFLRWMCESSAQ